VLQPKILNVEPLDAYKLRLCYETGETKVFDVLPYISGDWFGELKNKEYFRTVRIVAGGFGIEWGNGQDIAPHELYEMSSKNDGFFDSSEVMKMTTLNQLLIAEATEYEFKSAVEANKPRSWLKTVSAFANGVGGSIYFGVSNDGVVMGLDNPQEAAERVSELIKTRIDPAIKNIVLEPLKADGKNVLRVLISGGANPPYYYVGDGNKVVFYRIRQMALMMA
jgi:hypothetical protein